MRLFKIKQISTGLFSMGGNYPDFNENGKIWTGTQALKLHIYQWVNEQVLIWPETRRASPKEVFDTHPEKVAKFMKDYEIVELEFNVIAVTKSADFKTI